MPYLQVEGGSKLSGTWEPQGSKNEAAMALAAALLTDEAVCIENCPSTPDIDVLLELLDGLGATVTTGGPGTITIRTPEVIAAFMETPRYRRLFSSVRVSVNLIGPLLARGGYVCVPPPGGDRIGNRRLDTLLSAFEALGHEIRSSPDGTSHEIRACPRRQKSVLLDEASVTGTAALCMACATFTDTTELLHAACEPDVERLCRMLVGMGVAIQGVGSNRLTIQGASRLGGCRHVVGPDIMEIGSVIALAVTTRSILTISSAPTLTLGPVTRTFQRLGVRISGKDNSLTVDGDCCPAIEPGRDRSPPTLADGIWPGFPTDLLGLALAAATGAKGSALFHQRLYERRLLFVSQLQDMGARILLCDPHRAFVMGLAGERLRGSLLRAPDIRSGMALLAAALGAEGTSVIEGVEQLDRGYTRLDERLTMIGARIERRRGVPAGI